MRVPGELARISFSRSTLAFRRVIAPLNSSILAISERMSWVMESVFVFSISIRISIYIHLTSLFGNS